VESYKLRNSKEALDMLACFTQRKMAIANLVTTNAKEAKC
jgi:hypothetical protein